MSGLRFMSATLALLLAGCALLIVWGLLFNDDRLVLP